MVEALASLDFDAAGIDPNLPPAARYQTAEEFLQRQFDIEG